MEGIPGTERACGADPQSSFIRLVHHGQVSVSVRYWVQLQVTLSFSHQEAHRRGGDRDKQAVSFRQLRLPLKHTGTSITSKPRPGLLGSTSCWHSWLRAEGRLACYIHLSALLRRSRGQRINNQEDFFWSSRNPASLTSETSFPFRDSFALHSWLIFHQGWGWGLGERSDPSLFHGGGRRETQHPIHFIFR